MRVLSRVLVLLLGITGVPTSASFGQSTAVAVGAFGTILRATDGGDTWTPQPSGTTAYLSGVAFADATVGVAVGSTAPYAPGSAVILRTTDGGATWTREGWNWPPDGLSGVCFADGNNGWAVGGRQILQTTDGGLTWKLQFQYAGVPLPFRGVSCVDANTGWAVRDGGNIYGTTDGGTTWTLQLHEFSVAFFNAVSFVDANTGWAVGGTSGIPNDFVAIYKTTDGGAMWTRLVSGRGRLFRGGWFVDA